MSRRDPATALDACIGRARADRLVAKRLPALGAVLICATLVTPVAAIANDRGWAEVKSAPGDGEASRVDPVRPAPGRDGDRLWMTRPNDTFERIAHRTTGSRDHARAIADYNGRRVDAPLEPDALLYVPGGLLLPAADSFESTSWEIREFDDVPPTPADKVDADAATSTAVQQPLPVVTQRLDLFAGEVDVLGKVSVSRVAVGNGDIVRAEVLKTGELLLIAQSAGSSSLRLWHKDGRQSDYNIRVSESDPETRVRMERMVRMRVRMVEFRKSALGRLGIDWADDAAGPGFATAGDAIGNSLFRPASDGLGTLPNTVAPFSTYFGIATNITSRINFLSSNGDATTLAEPVLTASNGGEASFLAGGEVPYPSVGTNGQTVVQFKEYGIRLDVAPTIDSAGNVRAQVRTEISQIDPAVSVQGAPGLLTRRAQTEVNVRSGETIVISGLLSSESSKDVDKLPGIGNLPVIGAFFRSQSRREAVSELVIFVTPEVIDPAVASLDRAERERFTASGLALDEARDSLPLLD